VPRVMTFSDAVNTAFALGAIYNKPLVLDALQAAVKDGLIFPGEGCAFLINWKSFDGRMMTKAYLQGRRSAAVRRYMQEFPV
jgi:hypothetical protein